MLKLRALIPLLLVTVGACAGKQADTAPPPPAAAPEPPPPSVDPAVFEANTAAFEELNAILPQFKSTADAAAAPATELQAAVTAASELGESKGVKTKNVDRSVADSLKKGKVKLRGVKKADKEEMTTAVQAILDKVEAFKTTPQAVADAKAKVEELKAQATEIANAAKTRLDEAAPNATGEDKTKVESQLSDLAKFVEAIETNSGAANGMLDDVAKNSATLAEALKVTLEEAKAPAAEAPAADAAAGEAKPEAATAQ